MAKYNHKMTNYEKGKEKLKKLFKPLPQVIPQSKWDQMALELSVHKKQHKKMKNYLLFSIAVNLIFLGLLYVK
jgi:hypothetical protein